MDLTYGAVPEYPRSDKTSFGLHLYLEGRYYENLKAPEAPLDVNSARAIIWLVGVTIYCSFGQVNEMR